MNRGNYVTGVLLTLGVLGLAGSNAWLKRSFEERNTVDFRVAFDDVKGLKGGEEVRVAGFQVGSVKSLSLGPDGRKVIVLLRVNRNVRIPRDSKISVSSGLLGGNAVVTIVPGQSQELIGENTTKNAPLEGEPAAGLDSALVGVSKYTNDDALRADLTATAHSLREVSEKINRLGAIAALDDPKGDLQATLRNLRAASAQLPNTLRKVDRVVANADQLSASAKRLGPLLERQITVLSQDTRLVIRDMDRVILSGQRIARQTEGLAGEARQTVAESRESIKALLNSANDAASGAAGLTEQLTQLIGDEGFKSNILASTQNLSELSGNLVKISSKLEETTGKLSERVTDPELLDNIKATVANVKDASGSMKNLLGRVESLRIPGERRAPSQQPDPGKSPSLVRKAPFWYEPGLTGDFLYDTKSERFRLDVNYAQVSGGLLYRGGIADFAESSRGNLQIGQKSGELWTRYGLFSGKLGIGFDTQLGPLQWRLDLQDPNRFTVNTRLRARLNKTAALTLGVDSVGNGNRPMIGVQIRK